MNLFNRKKSVKDSDSGKKFTLKVNIKSFVEDLMTGTLLKKDSVQRQLPFFIFMVILALTYINNCFLYESDLKRKAKAQIELENTKYESLTMSRQLMEMGRRSKIQERLSDMGSDLEEMRTPVIVIKD
jgi:hypothetical protein